MNQKAVPTGRQGFAKILIVVVAVVLVGVAGYFIGAKNISYTPTPETYNPPANSNTNTPAPQQPSNPAPVDYCYLIKNSIFSSVARHEIGLGPNGVVMGYWTVAFTDVMVNWTHSDVGETGTFSCSNNVVRANFSWRTVSGSYTYSTGILKWDGVDYKKQ